jgi:osmotically-inducible protein OsmY
VASNQGIRWELVVFSLSMSAYPTDFPGTVPLLGVSTMQRSSQVPDKRICQKVEQRVSRAGLGSQARIKVQVRKGDVTLSGTLQYDRERRPVLRAARGVEGVRGIVDQLHVKAAPKKWQ